MGFRFHGCEVKTVVNRDDNRKRLRQSAADLAARVGSGACLWILIY